MKTKLIILLLIPLIVGVITVAMERECLQEEFVAPTFIEVDYTCLVHGVPVELGWKEY